METNKPETCIILMYLPFNAVFCPCTSFYSHRLPSLPIPIRSMYRRCLPHLANRMWRTRRLRHLRFGAVKAFRLLLDIRADSPAVPRFCYHLADREGRSKTQAEENSTGAEWGWNESSKNLALCRVVNIFSVIWVQKSFWTWFDNPTRPRISLRENSL